MALLLWVLLLLALPPCAVEVLLDPIAPCCCAFGKVAPALPVVAAV